jgi:hypothetical protein
MLGDSTTLLDRDPMYGKEMPPNLSGKANMTAGVAVEDIIF